MHNLLLFWFIVFYWGEIYGIPWKLVIRCKNQQKNNYSFLKKKEFNQIEVFVSEKKMWIRE